MPVVKLFCVKDLKHTYIVPFVISFPFMFTSTPTTLKQAEQKIQRLYQRIFAVHLKPVSFG